MACRERGNQSPTADRRVLRLVLVAVLVLGAGVGLGLVGRLSDQWTHAPRLLFALGAPWLVVAFAVGLLGGEPRWGAVRGAAALLLSVLVYYAVFHLVEHRIGGWYALWMGLLWGGTATLVGAVFGAAGASARRPEHVWPTALLGGALTGEAGFFLLRGETGMAAALLVVIGSVGLALPLTAARVKRHAPVLAATTAVALGALVIDGAVRVVMRRYGWGGY